jgi:hypothetical protein
MNLPDEPRLEEMSEPQLRAVIDQSIKEHALENKVPNYAEVTVFENVARYTPALSDGYIKTVERLGKQEEEAKRKKTPTKNPFDEFDFGADDLKFINPDSKLCFYPWVLFSGGQGAKTKETADVRNWVTTPEIRDPRVVVIGDSGGFQIQQQTIPFDPKTTPERMLRWLERVADQSMILDFPTGGIATGAMVPHVEQLKQERIDVTGLARKHGFSEGYMACLLRTEQNNDYFRDHRVPGATNLLNVIQGRNEAESAFWYSCVKKYSQSGEHPFEGWAFAGKHSVQLSMTLRRLVQMRDDGLLKPDQYIHFLGVSTLKVGVALTFIQRALREHTEATNVQLAFDSKSPVDAMVNGYQAITGYDFSPDRWSIRTQSTNVPENENSEELLMNMAEDWAGERQDRYRAKSSLAHLLQQKDLIARRDPITGKAIPTALQQVLLVHHNTQALIEAFRHAYGRLDGKAVLERPQSVRWLDDIIQMVFRTEAPMSLINALEKQSKEARDMGKTLRAMPRSSFRTINECESQLDALAYEGAFGK